MSGIINFLITYIALLVFWLIVNGFFYALTVVTRRGFFFIPFAINTLLNWAIQIIFIAYPLYIVWQIIVAKEWLLLVLFLILGGFLIRFWQVIIGFLTFPFTIITIRFSEKAAKNLETKEEEIEYEVLSPEGEVVGKYQSWSKTHKELAKWFVISFIIAFVNQFMRSDYGEWLGLTWYLIIPMFGLILGSIVIGFFVGIYNLIKKRKFFGEDRYIFLSKTLKIYVIIYGISLIAELLL